jgi:hypothetical protein
MLKNREKCIEFIISIREEKAEGFFFGRSFCSDYDFRLAFNVKGTKIILHENRIILNGDIMFMVLFYHLQGIRKYEIKDELEEDYRFQKEFNVSYLDTRKSSIFEILIFLVDWTNNIFWNHKLTDYISENVSLM